MWTQERVAGKGLILRRHCCPTIVNGSDAPHIVVSQAMRVRGWCMVLCLVGLAAASTKGVLGEPPPSFKHGNYVQLTMASTAVGRLAAWPSGQPAPQLHIINNYA